MVEDVCSMRIGFDCTRCGRRIRAPITGVGKQTLCPNCGLNLRVPHPGQAHADAETGHGLRLPRRVGHAKYLQALEQTAAARSSAPRAANRRRIGKLSWVLIAVNAVALGIVVALVVMWIVGAGRWG